MEDFSRAFHAYAAGGMGLDTLQATLIDLIEHSPEAAGSVFNHIEEAFRQGIINASTRQELVAIVDARMPPDLRIDKGRAGVAVAPGRAAKTQARPVHRKSINQPHLADKTLPRPEGSHDHLSPPPPRPQPHPSGPRSEPGFNATDSAYRLEDPRTWTAVGERLIVEGSVLSNKYQLERILGEGGMGVVYLARDLDEAEFDEQTGVAIKVLKPDFRKHPDALKALHEEANKGKKLAHPNIVKVYTFGRDGTHVFMTMEYLVGKPLDDLIDAEFARGMPFSQAWPIIEGMGLALACAHDSGVIHSDFKPANVFITAGGKPKVLDFGIARAMRRGRSRGYDPGDLGALTKAYAAIEMLAEEPAKPDQRDDIYAYGCVVYELLSGRHPFGSSSAMEALSEGAKVRSLAGLSKSQNQALAGALAFKRDERTGSIEEVIEGLRSRAAIEDGSKPKRVWLIAPLCVALLIGAVAWGWSWFDAIKEDQAFISSKLETNAEPHESINVNLVNEEMKWGNDIVSQARETFDSTALSEGTASALGAYNNVLDEQPTYRPAAEGILEIVKLYEKQARELRDQQQFKQASQLVVSALKIAPDRTSLKKLQQELTLKAVGVAAEPLE